MTSLYDKYGGFSNISAAVHRFYEKVLETESLQSYFANTDIPRLIDHQTQFLCMVLGGPVTYQGQTLQRAHARLQISGEAFDTVAKLLAETLLEVGFEQADIDTVIGVVGQARSQVVSA